MEKEKAICESKSSLRVPNHVRAQKGIMHRLTGLPICENFAWVTWKTLGR